MKIIRAKSKCNDFIIQYRSSQKIRFLKYCISLILNISLTYGENIRAKFVNIPFTTVFICLVLASSARSHSPGLCNFRSLASHPVSAHKSCRGIIENMFYVNSPAFPGLTQPVLITGEAYSEFCTMLFPNIIYDLINGKFISVGQGFLRNVLYLLISLSRT